LFEKICSQILLRQVEIEITVSRKTA